MRRPTFVKDQNGTVFSDLGSLNEAEYRDLQAQCCVFPKYEDLPTWDSRLPAFIEDQKVSGNSDSEPGASPEDMGKGQ